MTDIDKLLTIMRHLRSEDGCPWDREQTPESLKPCLVEETYEVLHALDENNPSHVCEELGDLLLQVVFHAQIASEAGDFDMQAVIDGITRKLIHRHPHVFGETKVKDAQEVLYRWEKLKAQEKSEKDPSSSRMADIPPAMPAFFEAMKIGNRAARAGFDWRHAQEVVEKIREEVDELETQISDTSNVSGIREEVGDLLFAVVNLCRLLKVDPETSLKAANLKFVRRFQYMEKKLQAQGRKIETCDMSELEMLWQEAKQWAS